MVVELVLEGVSGPARSGAVRVAALDHEVLDDAVEGQPVVETIAGELAKVLNRLRRVLVEELNRDGAGVGVKGGLRHLLPPYRGGVSAASHGRRQPP